WPFVKREQVLGEGDFGGLEPLEAKALAGTDYCAYARVGGQRDLGHGAMDNFDPARQQRLSHPGLRWGERARGGTDHLGNRTWRPLGHRKDLGTHVLQYNPVGTTHRESLHDRPRLSSC